MSDLHLTFGLAHHFTQRLRQYLQFLQLSNDPELIQMLFSFLDLGDLLQFLAISSHFYEFRKLQSVEIRILRARVAHYEQPKIVVSFDPFLHLLPIKGGRNEKKMQSAGGPFLRFGKQPTSFIKPKIQGVVELKKSDQKMLQKAGLVQESKINDDFHIQNIKLEETLKHLSSKEQSWAKVNQNQIQHLRQFTAQVQGKPTPRHPDGKKVIEYNPKTSILEVIEHHHARQDYERRKLRKKKEIEQEEFIPKQQLKKFAERDPCCRLVFNSVYEEQKAKQQSENVSKLRMRPTPVITGVVLSQPPADVKVMKQSIAGKLFSNIKSIFLMGKQ